MASRVSNQKSDHLNMRAHGRYTSCLSTLFTVNLVLFHLSNGGLIMCSSIMQECSSIELKDQSRRKLHNVETFQCLMHNYAARLHVSTYCQCYKAIYPHATLIFYVRTYPDGYHTPTVAYFPIFLCKKTLQD